MATIETLTKEQAVERGWEFGVGTVPDSGVINREVLWRETFDTAMKISGTTRYSTYDDPDLSTSTKTEFKPSTIESYNAIKDGCEVSDGNVSAITYSGNDNVSLSKNATNAARGKMFGGYLSMHTGGIFRVNGIKNYSDSPRLRLRANIVGNAYFRLRVFVNGVLRARLAIPDVNTGAISTLTPESLVIENGDLIDAELEAIEVRSAAVFIDNVELTVYQQI